MASTAVRSKNLPMTSPKQSLIQDRLAAVLQTVRTPGDFFTSGVSAIYPPLLCVAGVGPIALPLLPDQAERLIRVAERAPYGRGAETLVNTAVRRTWQIGADQVEIQGKHWAAGLLQTPHVTTGLKVMVRGR